MITYIATVEYYDEFETGLKKDTILLRAPSYAEAAAQIENAFKDTLESIVSFTAVSDMAVIHLGDGPDTQKCIDVIMQENSF